MTHKFLVMNVLRSEMRSAFIKHKCCRRGLAVDLVSVPYAYKEAPAAAPVKSPAPALTPLPRAEQNQETLPASPLPSLPTGLVTVNLSGRRI